MTDREKKAEWVKGYRAAVKDMESFLGHRIKQMLPDLFATLRGDANDVSRDSLAERREMRKAQGPPTL